MPLVPVTPPGGAAKIPPGPLPRGDLVLALCLFDGRYEVPRFGEGFVVGFGDGAIGAVFGYGGVVASLHLCHAYVHESFHLCEVSVYDGFRVIGRRHV